VSDPQPPAWTPDDHPTRAYGAPPPPPQQYGAQPPQYGAPPRQQPLYGQPPYYGQLQQPQYQQPAKSKTPWLLAGGIAVVVALIGGTGVFLATRGTGNAAVGDPLPTATYSDGVTSSETPSPTASTSSTPPPAYTPKPTPTPSPERRRTLKDIDEGLKVYDDVYVKPASGWRKARSTQYSITLGAQNKPGAVMVVVSPAGYPARVAVGPVAQALITADHLKAVKKSAVKTLSPANSNIGSQAQLSYSGRYTGPNGAVISLVARCTTMTGVESIHNVTVTLCVAARKDAQTSVFRDGDRMLASVARSI